MAFTDPILIPVDEEKNWSAQIRSILLNQLNSKQEIPFVSIFLVPEIIKKHKPEAYEPQQIGLGPNYHFKPWLYKKMEQRKLTVVRRIQKQFNIKDFDKEVLKKVWNRVCDIRGCYDLFLQDDDNFLAWILTIDGLFLLFLLHSYNSGVENGEEMEELQQNSQESNEHVISVEVDTGRRLFAQDLMMAENQIPFTVLKEIDMALNSRSGNSNHSDDNISGYLYRAFCEAHSPLELCSLSQAPSHAENLLHYMYHSIVNNVPLNNKGMQVTEESFHGSKNPAGSLQPKKKNDSSLPAEITGNSSSLGILPSPTLHFLQNIPWEKFIPLYKQTVKTLETFCRDRTDIYSASKLHGAGFKFHLLPKDKGIWKIDSKGKDICLPCLTLHTDSEVILRNLVVYEMLMVISDNFPLTEYVGLMCGLIMDVNDVKLLKREKIIEGDLREDEVVKIFNGMSSSITAMETKKKSKLQQTIEEVKTAYESQLRIPYSFLRKVASGLLAVLQTIGMFAGVSLKIVAFLISLMTVFLLTSQAYCEAYGCAKTNVSLLTYNPFSQTT